MLLLGIIIIISHYAYSYYLFNYSPLTTGLSCIIHSQTGSGKTLTYLLPLLKRLYNEYEDKKQWQPMQAMIIVPTKELVVQVAADIVSLTSEDNKCLNSSLVHICLTNSNTKTKVTAPIVIGTPIKILDMLRSTPSIDISKIQYLVIDEVDRIISALSKYATTEEKKDAKKSPTAISEVLSFIRNAKSKEEFKNMQIIGASATIGRPLRREFFRILNGGDEFGNIPVISPKAPTEISSSPKPKLELEDIDIDSDEKIVSTTRAVGIPSGIRHIAVLCTDESENLSSKLAVAKEQWVSFTKENPSRGMLFVPIQEDGTLYLLLLSFIRYYYYYYYYYYYFH
jgi:superfamily II DNA/RNA helicase